MGTLFWAFLDSKRLTRELVAPTTASSVKRDVVAGISTSLSMKLCKGDGRRETGVELIEFGVLAGDFWVASRAAV